MDEDVLDLVPLPPEQGTDPDPSPPQQQPARAPSPPPYPDELFSQVVPMAPVAPTAMMMPMYAAAGMGENGLGPHESAHMLGLSLVVLLGGAVAGVKFIGGPLGAALGVGFGGAALNLLRAIGYYRASQVAVDPQVQEYNKREARISATYAVVVSAGAGYVTYRLRTNGSVFSSNESKSAPNPCRIRPAGP